MAQMSLLRQLAAPDRPKGSWFWILTWSSNFVELVASATVTSEGGATVAMVQEQLKSPRR